MAVLSATADQIEQAKLDRRRKLAESFAMNSLQQSPTQVVSGRSVKQGPLEAISKLAQAFLSRRIDTQADEKSLALAQARDARMQAAWGNVAGSPPQRAPAPAATPAPTAGMGGPGDVRIPPPAPPNQQEAAQQTADTATSQGDVTVRPMTPSGMPPLGPGEYYADESNTNPTTAPVTVEANKLNLPGPVTPPAQPTREALLQQALRIAQASGSPVEAVLGTPWFKTAFEGLQEQEKRHVVGDTLMTGAGQTIAQNQKTTATEQDYQALDRANAAGDTQRAASIQAKIDAEKAPKPQMITLAGNKEVPGTWNPKTQQFEPLPNAQPRDIFNPQPLVNLNMTQERAESSTVGKGFGERFMGIHDLADSTMQKAQTISRINQLLEGVNTGKFTPFGTEVAAGLKSLGINVDANIGNKQAAQAGTRELALQFRNPAGGAGMPGNLSNQDRDYLESMTPGIAMTPEGRKLLVQTYQAVAKRTAEIARMARDYRQKHGQFDEGFYNERAAFVEANPLFANAPDPAKFMGGVQQGGQTVPGIKGQGGWTIEEVK